MSAYALTSLVEVEVEGSLEGLLSLAEAEHCLGEVHQAEDLVSTILQLHRNPERQLQPGAETLVFLRLITCQIDLLEIVRIMPGQAGSSHSHLSEID